MNEPLSRRTVTIIIALCAILTVSMAVIHIGFIGFGVNGDGLGYYAPLRSILFDHDLVVANEYEYFANTYSRFGGGSRWPHPIPQYSKYTIGMALILAPFYLAAHIVVYGLSFLGISSIEPNGLTWPYELFYCVGSVLVGIAGLICIYRSCRLFFGRMPSLLALLGVWAASPLSYYLIIENSLSHAVSQGVVSALLYVTLRSIVQHKNASGILMGTLLGLAILVRPQNVIYAIFPATVLLSNLQRRQVKVSLYAAAWMLALCMVFMGAQALVYLLQYGTVVRSPYLTEGTYTDAGASFNWFRPALLHALFSGHRGLFTWHPLTLLGAVGLALLAKQNKYAAIAAVAALCFQIYLVAAWHSWWQGAAVGSRMFSSATLIFALGIAAIWHQFPKRLKTIPIALTLFFIIWNGLVAAQYMSRMIPTEAPVSAKTLLTNQVKVIPYLIEYAKSERQIPDL